MKEIVIATNNKGKVKEFEQMFSALGTRVKSLQDFEEDIDVEETGETFEENALLKAETISRKWNIPVIADDSGIVVDALDGRPGVYSARYAGEEKNDKKNLEKVLNELGSTSVKDRTARFVCVIAVAIPGEESFTKRGTCEGAIALQPRGEHGFGYDPIFIPNGYKRTMAELTAEEKNSISHRRNALKKLEGWLREKGE
ncbi:XTP/dITP diphosphatase [Salimicrobium halophilum]|uniref:dITP/XTP pyrophosphatase n=1 Tax=Salimicrobium halophilum TaxID=86666 RepID=A0A1G8VEM1_9BACI|nr:XTP/dITP diphosphatase [Salimicrobium halophilum]SDJ64542.1 XTP/dITP diphosphohydrolase [Salimicrobium halophilum]